MISDGGPIRRDQARLIVRQPLLRPRRKWAIYRPTAPPLRHDDVVIGPATGDAVGLHGLSRLIRAGTMRYDTARADRAAGLMTVVPAVRDVCTL